MMSESYNPTGAGVVSPCAGAGNCPGQANQALPGRFVPARPLGSRPAALRRARRRALNPQGGKREEEDDRGNEFGLVPADHPIVREGWFVGLPLS